MSRYILKYLCEQHPKFNDIKINNQNVIYNKYLKKINEDNEMKEIWEDVLNNIEKYEELAKKKYIKKLDEKYKDEQKKYAKEYYKDYYKTHEKYKEYKKQYHINKKFELQKLKEENEKLKNAIKNINENLLNVTIN